MSYQQTKHQLWIDRVSIPADNGMANWVWHRCYVQGFRQPNYPVPAIRNEPGQKPWHNKTHVLNHGMWRWYWYLSGL